MCKWYRVLFLVLRPKLLYRPKLDPRPPLTKVL
jgi:hypothetical protein